MIRLDLTGLPHRNEEGALDVAARLVRRLNSEGAHWSEPAEGLSDVDALSTDVHDSSKCLKIQVVRATNESVWRTLANEKAATKSYDVPDVALELIVAIRKKAKRYPSDQLKSLNLIIDAQRAPSQTFSEVHESFADSHGVECRKFGFASIWVVGSIDTLIKRLDA